MILPVKPVFYDPAGRRAKAANIVVATALIAIALGLVGMLFAVLVSPSLPRLSEPPRSQAELRGAMPDPGWRQGEPKYSPLRNRRLPALADRGMRLAFFSSADHRSFASLQRHAAHLDGIIPDWLNLVSEDGEIASVRKRSETEVRDWLRAKAGHIGIYPMLSSRLPPAKMAAVIGTADRRERFAAEIGRYLQTGNYNGIVLSLPHIPITSNAAYAVFLQQLRRALASTGKKVIVAVLPDDGQHRYPDLARSTDYLLINTYDSTYGRTLPGPIASQGWMEQQIRLRVRDIDPGKLIIGIGSFGYQWEPFRPRQLLSVQAVWNILGRTKTALHYDKEALNPGFSYVDAQGNRNDVWYLDGVTAFNHARAALAVRPAGLALWRLGLEDPTVWTSIGRGRRPDLGSLDRLNRPTPTTEIAINPSADALATSKEGEAGLRRAAFDAGLGLITHQALQKIPLATRVEHWGNEPSKVIALTFDDGPDDRYTPQILDILREKDAKATFFVVGRNGVRHPNILQRIYDEGHDIGNHTFSHPELRERGSAEIELELNATQRVLESQLGIRTSLFRPPYASDWYFNDPEAARVLETASRLGYITIPVTVDPSDWVTKTKKQIHDLVVSQAVGEGGRIVLLHDAGGNRAPTLAALPDIIDSLRGKGFTFVTVHELLDHERTDILANIQTEGAFSVSLAYVTWAAMLMMKQTSAWLPAIAIAAAVLGALRLMLVIVAAWAHRRVERARTHTPLRMSDIAILIPAHNEEKVISRTIASLIQSPRPRAQIIVIDDGSTDRTAAVARADFGTDRVEVYTKENGGKSSALNFGLEKAHRDVVVAIDADTILAPDAIGLLVRHFSDPSVGAVAGSAIVGNPVTLMARFQALEYVTSQNLDRRAFEHFNAIGVVPGAIGAWRTQALRQIGGFSHDTLAEDADATVAIQRAGWRVVYEPRAVAFTEAPERLRAFLNQRFRWMYGMLQVAFKHIGVWRSGRPLGISFVTLPNILLFQFAFTLLAPLIDLMLIVSLLLGLREWLLGLGQGIPEDLRIISLYWLVFQSCDAAAAAIGIALGGRFGYLRLLPLILVQRFCYRQLLYVVAIRTILAAIKGQLVGWGKLLRTGNVRVTGLPSAPRTLETLPATQSRWVQR